MDPFTSTVTELIKWKFMKSTAFLCLMSHAINLTGNHLTDQILSYHFDQPDARERKILVWLFRGSVCWGYFLRTAFAFPSNRFCFAFVFFFHSSWAMAAFVSTPLLPVACPSQLTELTLNWADIVLLFNKHKKLSEWPFRSRVGTFILFFADSVHVKSKRLCKKLLKCSGVQCMSDV